jgi:hypothetical protein
MARRINYGFEKRQKEAKRKKKQEEKLEKKRMAKERAVDGSTPVDGSVPATTDAGAAPIDEATGNPGEVSS